MSPNDLMPLGWAVPATVVRKIMDALEGALEQWVIHGDDYDVFHLSGKKTNTEGMFLSQFRAMAKQTKADILREQVFVNEPVREK